MISCKYFDPSYSCRRNRSLQRHNIIIKVIWIWFGGTILHSYKNNKSLQKFGRSWLKLVCSFAENTSNIQTVDFVTEWLLCRLFLNFWTKILVWRMFGHKEHNCILVHYIDYGSHVIITLKCYFLLSIKWVKWTLIIQVSSPWLLWQMHHFWTKRMKILAPV